MKKLLLFAIGLFLTGCVTREMSSVDTRDSFSKFVDNYYEEYFKLNPLEATTIADNRYRLKSGWNAG